MLQKKQKADGRFKEALDYLEEAAKISPENENVKKDASSSESCYEVI